jgi:hypothetical protein
VWSGGLVAVSCEYGDEPSGSVSTELGSWLVGWLVSQSFS